MEAEIKEVIEKHLTKQVGEKLQERLALVDKLEKELADLKRSKEWTDKVNADLRHELYSHKQLDERTANVDVREKAVAKRESVQDVFEARLKQEEAEKRANQAVDLVRLVFKSPVYRTEVHGGRSGGNGMYEGHNETRISKEEDL